MKFQNELINGHFIKRYKRFFSDISIHEGKEVVIAHTPNTGTMKTCLQEGWPALISYHDSPTRKLKYTLEMLHNNKTWIGVNTSLTNALALEAIENGTIKELQGYDEIRPEFKVGNSRIDIFLKKCPDQECYVEIKNVTLVDNEGFALFPDAVTERGLKHLYELISLKKSHKRAVLLFIVQREDCHAFKIEQNIDFKYCQGLREAISNGVEVLAYQCHLTKSEIIVTKKMPII